MRVPCPPQVRKTSGAEDLRCGDSRCGNLGAGEDVFAFEKGDGYQDRNRGVETHRAEDHRDVIPMIQPGQDFPSGQTDVQDRDQRQAVIEFNAGQHRRRRRNDRQNEQGLEIRVGLLGAAGKQSNRQHGAGEENHQRQHHHQHRRQGR